MARKSKNEALPAVEATILVEGITASIVKCTARKAFRLNNVVVQEGETFFLVKSTKRENRYYVVHFDSEQNRPQCSCGANHKAHSHIEAYNSHVVESVASKPVVDSKSNEVHTLADGSRQITAAEWKEIHKRDKARQKAWADEYRQAAAALAAS